MSVDAGSPGRVSVDAGSPGGGPPGGWLRLDDGLARSEQFLYLQQPNYGTSYVTGKVEMEKLMAARKARLGADFRLKDHMDALNAAGLIPTSLLLWELSGK